MQLHIKLSPGKDADLIQALQSIPSGKRAERIRDVLTQGFVGGPDLARAVHRLATAIEQMPHAVANTGEPQPKADTPPLSERMKNDPALKAQVKRSILAGLD